MKFVMKYANIKKKILTLVISKWLPLQERAGLQGLIKKNKEQEGAQPDGEPLKFKIILA